MTTLSTATARWPERFRRDFLPAVIQRGEAYHLARSVKLRSSAQERVVADVFGTGGNYVVRLAVSDRVLQVACTCPFYLDTALCKHIWATMLEAAGKDVLGDALHTKELVPVEIEPEDLGTAAPRGSSRPLDARPWTPPLLSSPPSPAAPLAGWTRAFEGLRFQPSVAAPRAPAELAYVAIVDQHRLSVQVIGHPDARQKAGRGRQVVVDWELVAAIADVAERDAVGRLLGAMGRDERGYAFGAYGGAARFDVPAPAQRAALAALGATGKLFHATPGGLEPLGWDGAAWELVIDLDRAKGRGPFTLEGRLERDGEQRGLVSSSATDRVAIVDGRAAPLEGATTPWLRQLARPIVADAPDLEALLAELFALPNVPRVVVPASWGLSEVAVAPAATVVFSPPPGIHGGRHIPAALVFDYEGVRVTDAAGTTAYDPATKRLARRDRAAERAFLARAVEAGLLEKGAGALDVVVREIPAVTFALLEAGFRVEANGKLHRRSGAFRLEVTTGVDWFDVHGGADFEGVTLELPALLRAVKRAERTVVLGDGTVGLLPEAWMRRVGLLAGLAADDGAAGLRFKRSQAFLLDLLLATEGEPARADEAFERLRGELASLGHLRRERPGKAFRGKLRPYQELGLAWLRVLERVGLGGCLADDMGLGKTVQVLALLASADKGAGPSLVVAPRSVVHNWVAEAERFAPRLRVLVHHGAGRARGAEAVAEHDVVITTYGTLRRDAPALREEVFHYVILDEAQNIKNPSSDAAKAARLLRSKHRLALTGTPVENHLRELWSLFEFLNPGMLGRSRVFSAASSGGDPQSLNLLGRALRPFLLRRTKAQVATDLPPRQDDTLLCALEPAQRALYDELRDHYRASLLRRVAKQGMAKSKMHVLEALLRLRQAACHPGLVDESRAAAPSAKLDVLLEHLAEIREEGHKALVFSQFTSLLALVRPRLHAAGIEFAYLDGQTKDRAAAVASFQERPDRSVFLLSLKAGGVGLNLTAADYVFLLDPWWNPAVEAQAVDRAHRIGQTRPVFAYRLIAADTIEQKIAALQTKKRALAAAVVKDDESLLERLDVEDLELLLS